MAYMERPAGHARFMQLIEQPEALSNDDLTNLRAMIKMMSYTQQHVQPSVLMRTSIEIIDSLRKFDNASADLINTTNRLTEKVIVLTKVMLFVGVIGAVASGWSPLTWWITHGFRLR